MSSNLDWRWLFMSITSFVILDAHIRLSKLVSTFICIAADVPSVWIQWKSIMNILIISSVFYNPTDLTSITIGSHYWGYNVERFKERLTFISSICWFNELVLVNLMEFRFSPSGWMDEKRGIVLFIKLAGWGYLSSEDMEDWFETLLRFDVEIKDDRGIATKLVILPVNGQKTTIRCMFRYSK